MSKPNKSKSVNFSYYNTIYEALVNITCSCCKRTIKPTECFTRFADKKGTAIIGIRYVFCNTCRPLPIEFDSFKEQICNHK